jgi:hypothetical protein
MELLNYWGPLENIISETYGVSYKLGKYEYEIDELGCELDKYDPPEFDIDDYDEDDDDLSEQGIINLKKEIEKQKIIYDEEYEKDCKQTLEFYIERSRCDCSNYGSLENEHIILKDTLLDFQGKTFESRQILSDILNEYLETDIEFTTNYTLEEEEDEDEDQENNIFSKYFFFELPNGFDEELFILTFELLEVDNKIQIGDIELINNFQKY